MVSEDQDDMDHQTHSERPNERICSPEETLSVLETVGQSVEVAGFFPDTETLVQTVVPLQRRVGWTSWTERNASH